MEPYPADPYAYLSEGGGNFGDRFHNIEGILPVVLLVVIAFFVLQFLHVIPCVIPIGCGGDITVGLVGYDPSGATLQILSGKEATYRGIKYLEDIDPTIITLDMLKQFDVIILQGDQYSDLNAREALRSYVDGGGKLILVKDAATLVRNMPNVYGWEWPRGAGVPSPVELRGKWTGDREVSYGSQLQVIDINHPIVQGIRLKGARLYGSFNSNDEITEVIPEGKVIAAVKATDYSTSGMYSEKTVPAIIEGGSGLGRVMYFAYEPGFTPGILLSTIEYMGS